MTQTASNGPLEDHPDHPKPPAYFGEAISDAERLMKYAAEIGVDVDEATRAAILRARTAYTSGWTEEIGAGLLAALTRLAARLKPVNAESLKAFHDDTRPTVRTYMRMAVLLACIIVPVSLASFITSALSNALRTDIAAANELAVKLRAQLGPSAPPIVPPAVTPELPPGVNDSEMISELTEYASTIRVIYARARELHWLVIPLERVPFAEDKGDAAKRRARFELPPSIPDPWKARDDRTATYQDVRYFAQTLLNDQSVFYGAITTCILPVLYALLGTCAYLLRTFEDQMSSRTFTPSVANSARFLIAAIGGAVVGLFNNFTVTQEVSIPPLAIAFLVGYAVDVFFAFLEGLLKAFTKSTTPSLIPPPPPPVVKA
jgi:hypothetical protein